MEKIASVEKDTIDRTKLLLNYQQIERITKLINKATIIYIFADGINDSEISLKVIDFILDICRLSDKSIVIEVIEEKEQVDIIKTFLYEKIYIQGYYFSKPIPTDEYEKLIEE